MTTDINSHCCHCDGNCGDDHRTATTGPQTLHTDGAGVLWTLGACPWCLVVAQDAATVTQARYRLLVEAHTRRIIVGDLPAGSPFVAEQYQAADVLEHAATVLARTPA